MTISLQIISECDMWTLSANYDEKKKRYYGVSLKAPKDYFKNNLWDNNLWLYNSLLPSLKNMIKFNPTYNTNDLEMIEVVNYLCNKPLKEMINVIEILDKGKELGWHKIK